MLLYSRSQDMAVLPSFSVQFSQVLMISPVSFFFCCLVVLFLAISLHVFIMNHKATVTSPFFLLSDFGGVVETIMCWDVARLWSSVWKAATIKARDNVSQLFGVCRVTQIRAATSSLRTLSSCSQITKGMLSPATLLTLEQPDLSPCSSEAGGSFFFFFTLT